MLAQKVVIVKRDMKTFVTDNMEHVGPAVVRHQRRSFPDAFLHGHDNAYFAECLTNVEQLPERMLDLQTHGDVRELDPAQPDGCDAVVHLGAISDDPMGNRLGQVTAVTNEDTSATLARAVAKAGVRIFVVAPGCSVLSGCGVHAVAKDFPPRAEGLLHAVTVRAASMIGTEPALRQIGGPMGMTRLRLATAHGMTDRLRLDLVLNDSVACPHRREISVLSDGTPWWPLIDTRDLARAIDWAVGSAAKNDGPFVTVHAGLNDRADPVGDSAAASAVAVPGATVSITATVPTDSPSDQVDCDRHASLAPDNPPQVTLAQPIGDGVAGPEATGFADPDFHNSPPRRLQVLQVHTRKERLSDDLVWH
jgi:nucleoside-diphosphate-sugar epimerase